MKHYLPFSLCALALLVLGVSAKTAAQSEAFPSVTSLQSVAVSASTGEKPQSKVWTYGGMWWAVLASAGGTDLYRLDGAAWTSVLHLSDATDTHADVRVTATGVAHVLLYRGPSSSLVSVEFVPGTPTYQLWTVRPGAVALALASGVETATIDIDTQGRMWLASDNVTDVAVRWSDSPYSSWSSPITLASGINSDDISVVTAIPALGNVGVLWSNQNTKRFGFRMHTDGADPATWSADEVPASQSALNIGAGLADDHLHVAVASDGTVYAAVKTSYDTPGYPKIALLIRRPGGTWDNLYEVDQTGTRGIVLLNEATSQVTICYTQSEGSNDIVYKTSALSPIAFGTRQTLMQGTLNEPSSTKQNYTGSIVVLASTVPVGNAVGVLATTSVTEGGLVAYYKMDEGGGTSLRDTSGTGNHGVINSGSWASGMKGQSLVFDGTNTYATAANSASLDIVSAITIAAWVRPSVYATQDLVKKAANGSTNGYELSLAAASGNPPRRAFVRFNQLTSGDTYRLSARVASEYPTNGTWVHYAATYDGATIRFYVNGVLDTSKAATFTIASNTLPLGIGAESNGARKYTGRMDEVYIYNRALTASEIQALASHLITATAGAGGVISPTGEITVTHDGSQTFAITADPGYAITDVSVDGVSQGSIATYTFNNVIVDHAINATFVSTGSPHTITASAGPNGSISPSGAVSVPYTGSQTFTITPDMGYHIVDVLVDGGSIGAATSYTFTNVVLDHSISASFAINTYTLALSTNGNGTAVRDPDQTAYTYHTSVTLTATPGPGSAFSGWTGSVTGMTNPIVVYTDSAMAIVANFGSDLVGHWAMDEGAGSVLTDSSTYHNAGTTIGSPAWGTGVRGSALAFNGTSQYATVPDASSLDVTNAITIAVWVRPEQVATQDLVKKAVNGGTDGYELSLATSSSSWPQRVFFRFNQQTGGDTYRLSARATSLYPIDGVTWVHYAATYDGTTMKIYINGALDTSRTVSVAIATNSLPVSIAAENNGARPFKGALDDARIYRRALTAGEVLALASLYHTITASAGPNGSIAPSGAVAVAHNASQSFAITPDPGYQIATVTVDGLPAATTSPYLFSNVTADHTIATTFFSTGGIPETVTCSTTGTTYPFPISHLTLDFTVLPPGGGPVTVRRYFGAPPSPTYPDPPAGSAYIPAWFDITSTLPAGSFNGTVTVNVADISGFGSSTRAMYYNATSGRWVLISATYSAETQTMTFATTHFTAFAFINSLATAYDLFVSTSAAPASAGVVHPNATWAGGYPGRTEDWSFTGTQPFSLYLVPQAGTQIGGAELVAEWDSSVALLDTVIFTGSIFSGPNVLFAGTNRLGTGNRVTINASMISPFNVTAGPGDYIARLDMRLRKPGHSAVALIGARLTYFNVGSDPSLVYVIPRQAEVSAYLGDVMSVGGGAAGDGSIDFEDLVPWTLSYWSGLPPYGMTNYKAKYDIGPTQNGFVFALPLYDRKIDFEDLMIFSISYGQTYGHELPRIMPQTEPATVSLGRPVDTGSEVRVPVLIGGGVADIRAMSLELAGAFGSFIGAEKGAMLQSYATPVMVFGRSEGRTVFVDCAVLGREVQGLDGEGEVLVLRFAGPTSVGLTRADCRTSGNSSADVVLARGRTGTVPMACSLEQSYPNPFNPVTDIQFQIADAGTVSLKVYDLLGREVATLVDDVREPGIYSVAFDASGLSSGTYLYRLTAGHFVSVRRMLLLK